MWCNRRAGGEFQTVRPPDRQEVAGDKSLGHNHMDNSPGQVGQGHRYIVADQIEKSSFSNFKKKMLFKSP